MANAQGCRRPPRVARFAQPINPRKTDSIVTLILATRANVYSSSPLDRIATRREDHAWIEQQLSHPGTLFVPVWRSRNLVRGMEAITVKKSF